jgi:hypothetical protein
MEPANWEERGWPVANKPRINIHAAANPAQACGFGQSHVRHSRHQGAMGAMGAEAETSWRAASRAA